MPGKRSTNLTDVNISDSFYGILHAEGVPLPSDGQQIVYDGNGNASALQLGRVNNGVTITGTLSTAGLTVRDKLSASNLDILTLVDLLYPVGSAFFSIDNTNPGVRFIGTTWTQVGAGRYLAGIGTTLDNGIGTTNILTLTAGNNSGQFEQSITTPNHTHGTGTFRTSTDDNWWGIIDGWDDNTTYTIRLTEGKDNTKVTDTVSSAGGNGTGTTLPINKASYNINIKPATFAMYVWQRTL